MIDLTIKQWKYDALCSQANPDAWFPEHDGDSELRRQEYRLNEDGKPVTAKQVCQRCPVKAECLQEALDNKEQHGIWGGLTTKERAKLMKQRRQA